MAPGVAAFLAGQFLISVSRIWFARMGIRVGLRARLPRWPLSPDDAGPAIVVDLSQSLSLIKLARHESRAARVRARSEGDVCYDIRRILADVGRQKLDDGRRRSGRAGPHHADQSRPGNPTLLPELPSAGGTKASLLE